MSRPRRLGFTLVELLIVIAIIGVLMGLLLPAIQAARERARMATCSNNVGQLGKAMFAYASSGKGTFPGWAEDQQLVSGTNREWLALPWSAKILPQLDQQSLRDQLLTMTGFDFSKPSRIDVFLCPDDIQLNAEQGSLTYVANSGMPDPTNHPLPADYLAPYSPDVKANGICHDLRSGRGKAIRVRLGGGDLPDGASRTLLISENVQKDEELNTWLGPINAPNGLPVSNRNNLTQRGTNPEQRFGMIWVVGPSSSPFQPEDDHFQPISRDLRAPGDQDSYGNPSGLEEYAFARPASVHPEVFMAAFCEGNTREINNDIDYRVYQQLMTPNGLKTAYAGKNGDPIEANFTAGQGFMSPPLGDNDY
jgi:prepilin-type N-terminal cleavage/methylation domain-containing protein